MMAIIKSHRATREEFERDAIRLLCSELIEPGPRARLAELLKNYVFVDDLNQAVYELIMSVGSCAGAPLMGTAARASDQSGISGF